MCYSDSDSEEETPTQQHRTLCTSYNFVDYVRSREILAPEVSIPVLSCIRHGRLRKGASMHLDYGGVPIRGGCLRGHP